jgi:PhnB protein
MTFLEETFGFTRGVTLSDSDGQIRYAEMRHAGSTVVLVRQGDASTPSGGASAIYAYVDDVDRVVAQAREHGAGVGEIEDRPWGDRVGTVIDPDGHRWLLATFRKLAPFT